MPDKSMMAIILPDHSTSSVGDMTSRRSLAALPFGGRYRLIDFIMSSIVNSGIDRVGVCPTYEYSSLMDHLGSGKPWDLSRKNTGLVILPPGNSRSIGSELNGSADILFSNINYISHCPEKYLLLARGNMVFNKTLNDALEYHIKKRADFTMLYHRSAVTSDKPIHRAIVTGRDGRISEMSHSRVNRADTKVYCNMVILERSALIDYTLQCISQNKHELLNDYVMPRLDELRVFGYDLKGYFGMVDDIPSYFKNNMNMLEEDYRNELFSSSNKIFTKVKDRIPAKYSGTAEVADSLVADGCIIDGQVEDSILARGVRVGAGSVVKHSLIMQDSVICPGCRVENVIFDKEVTLREGRSLVGQDTYPVIVNKGSVV